MKKHIFLIDDDKDELNILVEALNMTGINYKCTWAQTGEQALNQLLYLQPHVIFLDVNMPGMDGFTTLSAIRELPNCASLPIVMYSTGMDNTTQNKALLKGATACLKKPDNLAALASELAAILSSAGMRQQVA